MSNEKDVSGMIEHLEAFEERMGVRFEALSAWCGSHQGEYVVFVGGELHAHDGNLINQTIEVVADAYNSSGQLMGTDYHVFLPISFFGYETFMICLSKLPSINLGKIRVYPKHARH